MRRAALFGLVVGGAGLFASAALAQGPFGIATPEATIRPVGGVFGPVFAQIAAWQSEFYQTLTQSLGDLHERGSAFWVLAGVSFLYGVFHAAGPGHGKAVISAYLLASGETLRRGVVIAFAAAFVQAVVAIVLVSIAAGVLRVTAVTMSAATDYLEIGSYGLIVIVGLWLLFSRATGRHTHAHAIASPSGQRWRAERVEDHEIIAAGGAPGFAFAGHDHSHGSGVHVHGGDTHAEGEHSHAPDPKLLRRPLTLSSAWAAILAVGIRPCTGAIIVLVFALSQGLYPAGIGSTLIMALGTGLTVALLASLAVLARDAAIRLTNAGSRVLAITIRSAEILAALALVVLGALLLGGALAA